MTRLLFLVAISLWVPGPDRAAAELPRPISAADLDDELRPVDELESARLARQRGENLVAKAFGFRPVLIDPAIVRFRHSMYPLLHAAGMRFAKVTGREWSAAEILGRALESAEARARLAPHLAAVQLMAIAKPPTARTEYEAQLVRELSFYAGVLQRTAAFRLIQARRHFVVEARAVDFSTLATPEVDLMVTGDAGVEMSRYLVAATPGPPPVDGLGSEHVWAASYALALRTLGGVPLTNEARQALGVSPTNARGRILLELGGWVAPFVVGADAGAQEGVAEAADQAMRALARDTSIPSITLAERLEDPLLVASLVTYMVKRSFIDPWLAGRAD